MFPETLSLIQVTALFCKQKNQYSPIDLTGDWTSVHDKILLLIIELSNAKEQSPSWEANSSSATQEIPHILCDPKVYFCLHKSLPLVPILSQNNAIRPFPSHFLKIHFNIMLPSTPRASKWLLSLRFFHQTPACTSSIPHKCHMPCPCLSSWLINQVTLGEEQRS